MDDTINKIFELMKLKGISQKELADYLEVNETKISDWKAGRIKSYNKFIDKIAKLFDVSVDSLLSNERENIRDDMLYFKIQRLTDEQRAIIESLVDMILNR